MSSKERAVHEMMQTDKGRAWLVHCMLHGHKADRAAFERTYERESAARRACEAVAEQQRLHEWRKIPFHQRVYGVLAFQVFHLRNFGFWHPSGFVGPIFYGREDVR